MGRRSLLDLAWDPAVAAAGAIDLKPLASTQSRRHLFSAQFLSISPIPKVLCFWRRFSAIHHAAAATTDAVYRARRTTIVVDIIVMIGYATLAQRMRYG